MQRLLVLASWTLLLLRWMAVVPASFYSFLLVKSALDMSALAFSVRMLFLAVLAPLASTIGGALVAPRHRVAAVLIGLVTAVGYSWVWGFGRAWSDPAQGTAELIPFVTVPLAWLGCLIGFAVVNYWTTWLRVVRRE